MDVTLTIEPRAASSSLNSQREHDRGKEIDLKNMPPDVHRCRQAVEPLATVILRADPGIIDQSMQPGPVRLETTADFLDCVAEVFRIGKIYLDMVFRTGWPRAAGGKGVPRASDDTPAFGGEFLNRRMPDAATGTCENDGWTCVDRRAVRLLQLAHDVLSGLSSRGLDGEKLTRERNFSLCRPSVP